MKDEDIARSKSFGTPAEPTHGSSNITNNNSL